ncbi:MAG: hypothetical protein WBW01_04585 [Terriglobales bacterium]
MRNFTLIDALGILKACLALLPFMFAPGYVAGWTLDLFEFRSRRPILRLILAVPLSIAICPMLSYLLARFLEPALWVFYIVVFIACALLLIKDARGGRLWSGSRYALSKHTWIAMGLITLWGVAASGSMVDLQIGDKLYPPITAYDHSVRTAMMVAIARHVPPSNPFFANAAAPLRYHYLWLLFCSLPMKVFHLSPRYVVYSGVAWCGLGLMCVIAIGIKFLVRVQSDIEQKTLLAVGLLCVTGLDILPTLVLRVASHLWLSDMEWWNEPQITSWVGSLLWVPHHVGALIACFVAFLLLRHQADIHRRWATGPVIVAGMAFASAAGMSVYVTFTFIVAVALWLALVARKAWLEAAMFAGAGAVSLLWALSFLSSLRGPGSGGAFLEFALRPFPFGVLLVQRTGIPIQTSFALTLAQAVLLPLNYTLELGFFLAIGVLRLRQLLRGSIEASPNELAGWTLVATSFLIGTFLRSSTIGSNDLGWRCFLPAQLILLLWAAAMVDDWWFGRSTFGTQRASVVASPRPWTRAVLVTLLTLGVLGSCYQAFMLRMFPLLVDLDKDQGAIAGQSWVAPNRHFGKRAYALRSAYHLLDAQLPSSAVLQSNPYTQDLILHMLYSGHDSAAGDGGCGTDFGGDAGVCAERLRTLVGLFRRPDGSDLDATCQEYGIDALVVEDADPVWREPSSWVWSRRPIVANDYVRVFRCGAAADSIQR